MAGGESCGEELSAFVTQLAYFGLYGRAAKTARFFSGKPLILISCAFKAVMSHFAGW